MLFYHVAAAKEREKVEKAAAGQAAGTPKTTPKKITAATKAASASGKAKVPAAQSGRDLDMAALNLGPKEDQEPADGEVPKVALAREKLLEEVKATLAIQNKKSPAISLVVIGELSHRLVIYKY
jgi:elongation factor 1 alpha-like protein